MKPVLNEAFVRQLAAGALALCDFILVVRKYQVFPAQVQVTGAPIDYLDWEVTPDMGIMTTFPICQPPDPPTMT